MKSWLIPIAICLGLIFLSYWFMTKTTTKDTETIIHLTDANFEKKVLKNNLPVLVDFWAVWCGPCKQIAPIIEDIAATYKGKLVVAKVDVDKNQDVAQQYGIRSIPILIIFKNGKEVKRIVGAVAKENIVSAIEAQLK